MLETPFLKSFLMHLTDQLFLLKEKQKQKKSDDIPVCFLFLLRGLLAADDPLLLLCWLKSAFDRSQRS